MLQDRCSQRKTIKGRNLGNGHGCGSLLLLGQSDAMAPSDGFLSSLLLDSLLALLLSLLSLALLDQTLGVESSKVNLLASGALFGLNNIALAIPLNKLYSKRKKGKLYNQLEKMLCTTKNCSRTRTKWCSRRQHACFCRVHVSSTRRCFLRACLLRLRLRLRKK